MKYFVILLILFPMIVSAQTSGLAPSKGAGPAKPAGYTTKDCDNKCGKDQQCALEDDERYRCKNMEGYSDNRCGNKCSGNQICQLDTKTGRYFCISGAAQTPTAKPTAKPLEVYISCKTIGGLFKSNCSSSEIAVSGISGKTEIPIREHKPGQCCIPKSKLKIY
jgi:hypothetical protein